MACCALRAPIFCKQVYSLVMKNGFISCGYVQTRMVDLLREMATLGLGSDEELGDGGRGRG